MHVVAATEGLRIGVAASCLKVTGKDGSTVREIPLSSVDSLSVLGSVQISTQAIGALADARVPVAYLSAAGRMLAMIDPLDSVSTLVRTAQVRVLDRPEKRLEWAQAIITAKMCNQRTLLMRNATDLPADVAPQLGALIQAARKAETVESLRGLEGRAAAIYFAHFARMIRVPEIAEAFDQNGRQRRPPPDPINAVLSFAYTMLTHDCTAALRTARLEPAIGAYHVSRPGRPALALDLMEPFRPLIADSVAISAFNRGELIPGHFHRTAAGCAFTDYGRRAFFSALGRRMDTEVTHPVFEYRLNYRRMIILHARMLAAWLVGDIPNLHFLTTR
jgi:CRISPR-associated protein Cas1